MKRWAENPLAWPFTAVIVLLAFAVTPFTLLWYSLISKKASVREGRLLVGKEEVEMAQIEYVLIHAYWPFESFVLKRHDHRAVNIIPESAPELYALIKDRKIAVQIKGPRSKEFIRRLGLPG